MIPGLRQGAVPQGLAFAPKQNRLLISHYLTDVPSCISVIDASTGKMTHGVSLKEVDGSPHRGHVGGIAVLNDSLLVASDGRILRFSLADVLRREATRDVRPAAARKCETRADFCTADGDLLLVGEFAYGRKYPTDASHHLTDRAGVRKYAWVCGYAADDPLGRPKCLLSVRQKVQGMCVWDDLVFLSVSYGRANRSRIVVYRNPIGGPAHQTVKTRGGDAVPLWFLDAKNYVGEIDFPPMSEGIVPVGDRLAVLAESGAERYLAGGMGPLDRILLLDLSRFSQD